MQKDGNLRYQSASEMLRDLNMSIKNPDGTIVEMQADEVKIGNFKIIIIYYYCVFIYVHAFFF